ncbi:MAG: beta-propeller fold lactonase family protein [Chloroflexota bacterium]
MDHRRFDAATRALEAGATRRQGLAAALAALLAWPAAAAMAATRAGSPAPATRRGGPAVAGPCGDGSRDANRCQKDKECCTGFCKTRGGSKDSPGFCRCLRKGQTCAAHQVCCSPLACLGGRCCMNAWSNLTTFGSAGSGAGEFSGPAGLAVSADGTSAWIADAGNNRIATWRLSGDQWTARAAFGTAGSGPGQLDGPLAVAVTADGAVALVADTGNNRVSVWTRAGGAWSNTAMFGSGPGAGGTEFSSPSGVAVSADGGTAWVADTGNNRISVWANAGGTWSPLGTFGLPGAATGQLNQPVAVYAAASERTAWVTDTGNNRISVWTRAGGWWSNTDTFGFGPGASAQEFDVPTGVWAAADGRTVWVTDRNDHVSVWNGSPGAMGPNSAFGSGPGANRRRLNGPWDVALTADGLTAFVTDRGNNRVSVWRLGCR